MLGRLACSNVRRSGGEKGNEETRTDRRIPMADKTFFDGGNT